MVCLCLDKALHFNALSSFEFQQFFVIDWRYPRLLLFLHQRSRGMHLKIILLTVRSERRQRWRIKSVLLEFSTSVVLLNVTTFKIIFLIQRFPRRYHPLNTQRDFVAVSSRADSVLLFAQCPVHTF